MSIRARLVVMCLLVALLPAIPLTIVVGSLIQKSFNVGLNDRVEEALQSGIAVSRDRLDAQRDAFAHAIGGVAAMLREQPVDSSVVASAMTLVMGTDRPIDGFLMTTPSEAGASPLARFARTRDNLKVLPASSVAHSALPKTVTLYDTADRAAHVAVWAPADVGAMVIFFKETDAAFLAAANQLIDGRQVFAELKLTRSQLAKSFFYPFLIIYGIALLLALGAAMFMAERISQPIRRLAAGTQRVAEGDWNYRADVKASGETAALVKSFNTMLSRIDSQRRRLTDMEKIAAWGDMARHLAHEIKNPLLPIRLTMEELRDQYDAGGERYEEFLGDATRVVGEELDHLQNLVNEFREFASTPELTPSRGSLRSLAEDVARLYPQVRTEFEEGDAPVFAFDPNHIRSVIINLYDNVVSLADADIPPWVQVSVFAREGNAYFIFLDNGPGMDEATRSRVFDPYFTTRADGSGLGLAAAKRVVLLHGGTIDVQSKLGKGAAFTITMPLDGPGQVTSGGPSKPAIGQSPAPTVETSRST